MAQILATASALAKHIRAGLLQTFPRRQTVTSGQSSGLTALMQASRITVTGMDA